MWSNLTKITRMKLKRQVDEWGASTETSYKADIRVSTLSSEFETLINISSHSSKAFSVIQATKRADRGMHGSEKI